MYAAYEHVSVAHVSQTTQHTLKTNSACDCKCTSGRAQRARALCISHIETSNVMRLPAHPSTYACGFLCLLCVLLSTVLLTWLAIELSGTVLADDCCSSLLTSRIWPRQSGQPDRRMSRTFIRHSQHATAWPQGTATAEIGASQHTIHVLA